MAVRLYCFFLFYGENALQPEQPHATIEKKD